MVCSVCKGTVGKPNHNAATCPNLEIGAEQMATAIAQGAGETAAVSALTAICPPAGAVVGGMLFAKFLYKVAVDFDKGCTAKTHAERVHGMKRAVMHGFVQNAT